MASHLQARDRCLADSIRARAVRLGLASANRWRVRRCAVCCSLSASCGCGCVCVRRKGAESPRPAHASSPASRCAHVAFVSLAAMALWLVMPLRLISSMMGRTLGCNRLAFAFRAALRVLQPPMSGLPRRFPAFWRPSERLWYALKSALAHGSAMACENIAL